MLDLLLVDGGNDALVAAELERFLAIFAHVLHHVDDTLDEFSEVGSVSVDVARSREVK